jgi:hypothetical protein
MGLDMGPYGLAWAAAIVAVVEASILLVIMARRLPGLFGMSFVRAIMRMVSAAGFTALVTYIIVTLLPLSASDQSFFSSFPKFTAIVLVSGLSYFLASYMMGLDEVRPILVRAKKIVQSVVARAKKIIFYRNR